MTNEEKAKAYDEVMNKIKPLYEQAKKDGNPIRSTYEYLIPELRESEDERIRKGLVNFLQSPFIKENLTDEKVAPWVAYLEKQKEASKAIEAVDRIDKYIDEHLANAHDMKDSNPDKKYYRGWDDALSKMSGILQDVYSGEKQEEQKPAEWSEEDNIGWDEAFACVTRAEKAAKSEEELQNAVTAERWLKEIKFMYCVHPVKQEWSEEDEKKRQRIIKVIEAADSDWVLQKAYGPYGDLIYWLKSLRPSWKPSEEQMKALNAINCHGDLSYIGQQSQLISLYNDLKKLM